MAILCFWENHLSRIVHRTRNKQTYASQDTRVKTNCHEEPRSGHGGMEIGRGCGRDGGNGNRVHTERFVWRELCFIIILYVGADSNKHKRKTIRRINHLFRLLRSVIDVFVVDNFHLTDFQRVLFPFWKLYFSHTLHIPPTYSSCSSFVDSFHSGSEHLCDVCNNESFRFKCVSFMINEFEVISNGS